MGKPMDSSYNEQNRIKMKFNGKGLPQAAKLGIERKE